MKLNNDTHESNVSRKRNEVEHWNIIIKIIIKFDHQLFDYYYFKKYLIY